MPLSTARRAALVQLAARATNGVPVTPTTAGTLKAWRLDASEAETAQIDLLLDPAVPEPTAATTAYAAGQRRADIANAQQGGAL